VQCRLINFDDMQKDMMEDHKRTGAYHQAVLSNRNCFEGKVVLDVGTGSGILAIFAAQAGAKKVYAVEATSMAKVAKRMVESNQVWAVVSVYKLNAIVSIVAHENQPRRALHPELVPVV
jgi:predicted RNA methylase